MALPGRYIVKLIANGKEITQPLTVRMDPRVTTARAGLELQFNLASRLCELMRQDYDALQQVRASANNDLARQLENMNRQLAGLLELIEGADATPTTQAVGAVKELEQETARLVAATHAVRPADR